MRNSISGIFVFISIFTLDQALAAGNSSAKTAAASPTPAPKVSSAQVEQPQPGGLVPMKHGSNFEYQIPQCWKGGPAPGYNSLSDDRLQFYSNACSKDLEIVEFSISYMSELRLLPLEKSLEIAKKKWDGVLFGQKVKFGNVDGVELVKLAPTVEGKQSIAWEIRGHCGGKNVWFEFFYSASDAELSALKSNGQATLPAGFRKVADSFKCLR